MLKGMFLVDYMATKKGNSTKKVNKKLSKKKKKTLRSFVYSMFILAILGILVGIGFVINYLFTNAKFNIGKIVVSECEKYTAEDIITASGLNLGQNIFRISKKDIISKVEQLPYVESCEVDRNLPSILRLNVKERTGQYVAYAKDSGQYVRLDKTGVILEVIDVSKMEEETLMFGINFDDIIELGQILTELECEKLLTYEKIKKVYDKTEIDAKITSVEFSGSDVILTLNDKLNVKLKNNKELEYKVSFLKTILKEIGVISGTLDMTQDNPTYSAI